ncbi:aldo/keto reductase [Rhodobacterales bacterium HKCCE2091]|nr:aldo/keto reductase [Rhodobacterales bacterium HKCCE2091]
MRVRRIGASGLAASAIGLGCNNFGMRIDADRAREVVHAAIDAGITYFDTAPSYGPSEDMLGAALKGRRADVLIATKFGSPRDPDLGPAAGNRGSRSFIIRSVERSLKRLGTDWIDHYQLHFADPDTPIEETLSALDTLVRDGKVRYVGTSQMAPWQVVEAGHVARAAGLAPFISVQAEWSLLERGAEAEMVPAARSVGAAVIPFFPLASGLLAKLPDAEGRPDPSSRLASGPFARQLTPGRVETARRVDAWAKAHGRTLLELAIGLLVAQPDTGPVIAGATSPAQVAANAAAADWLDAAAPPSMDEVLAGA